MIDSDMSMPVFLQASARPDALRLQMPRVVD